MKTSHPVFPGSFVRFACATAAGLVLSAIAAFAQSPSVDRALLQRVADAILTQTTRRLIDHTTGQTATESSTLPLRPEISIESKFNAWFYQTWLLTDGMRRAAAVLESPAYRDYGEQNLAFLDRHLPYFERQHAAGMKAAPAGDGKLSPIAFYFGISEPWHTGLAPLVMEHWIQTRDPRHEAYRRRMDAYLAKATRTDDGAIFRPNGRLMADDPYMLVAYLLRAFRATGDKSRLDDAVGQILGAKHLLFEPSVSLYRHAYHLPSAKPLGQLWGRANGWMVLAQVEVLAGLPKTHPRYADVQAAFAAQAAGLRRVQDPAGGWHQLLDHPESWIETSCTGMFVYGLARGVNEGWLDRSATEDALRGWAALTRKVTASGDVIDVCGSTDVGDVNYYLNRPRLQGDLHGFGPFLLAGSEIIRLRRTSKAAGAMPP